ncbi:ATP-binding protein, partial [bacterium]
NQFPIISIPDPLLREANDHEAFAEIRRRTYIGRPDYFEALDRHASGDGGPLVLLGDSGSGKSALLANWLVHWRRDHPKDFIFQHYIGSTADSADHWRLMTRLVAEIKRWSTDPEDLPKSHDDLLRDFPVWLAKARIKAQRDSMRFIIVLDSLNQIEDREHGRLLGWLPSHPFYGPLRLLVSSLPGDTLDVVEKRSWASLRVQPLEPEERHRMIVHYLARFSKKLDAPPLERLVASPAAATPLYLKILLDELRVTGTLMRRALAIDEKSYGQDHPNVAIGLNNLAQLLKATNHLAEAEPVSWRIVEIFLKFTRTTGYHHPHLQTAVMNYAELLIEMGMSSPQIFQKLEALGPEPIEILRQAIGKQ